MGEVYADITLKNAEDIGNALSGYIKAEDVREVKVSACADSGAYDLCITEDVFQRLGLRVDGEITATVANGQKVKCKITSPVKVHWEDRFTSTPATVIPGLEEVLLGAIPMEGMDLMVHPRSGKVVGAHGDKPIYRI